MTIDPASQPLHVSSELDISLPSSPSKPLPPSPHHPTEPLPPTTKFVTPLLPPSSSADPASSSATHLASLADALDAARTQLNQEITVWKEWIGKEPDSASGLRPPSGAQAQRSNGNAQGNQEDEEDDDDDDDEDQE